MGTTTLDATHVENRKYPLRKTIDLDNMMESLHNNKQFIADTIIGGMEHDENEKMEFEIKANKGCECIVVSDGIAGTHDKVNKKFHGPASSGIRATKFALGVVSHTP